MVFSFFKKKGDNEAKPAGLEVKRPQGATPPPEAAASAKSPERAAATPQEASGGVDLLDTSDFRVPDLAPEEVSVLEEVAVLFANEQIDAAAALLESQVLGETRTDEELWLMLFELYHLKGDRAAFDDLALKFVVAFERSAPIWSATPAPADTAPSKQTAVCMLPAALTEASANASLEQLRDQCTKMPTARFDASRLREIDAAGAVALANLLKGLRKGKTAIEWVALPPLIGLLQGRVEAGRAEAVDQPYWTLMLECLQWGGDESAFEAAAIDYAVTYEESPPSWEPPRVAPKVSAAKPDVAAENSAANGADSFELPRVITAANDSELDPLLAYGAARQNVIVECNSLERLDFVAGGRLLNLLVQLQQQGKVVHLKRVSHLVAALMRVLGIHEFARISYRK